MVALRLMAMSSMTSAGSNPICAGCGSTRSASFSNIRICCRFSTAATMSLWCSISLDLAPRPARSRRRVARLSRSRTPQACLAQTAFWRRGATGGDRTRACQSTAHYSCRRADRTAGSVARENCDGFVAADCRRQRAAIIVVTHDEMILDRFDHIFRLRDGRLETEPVAALQS